LREKTYKKEDYPYGGKDTSGKIGKLVKRIR